jgi:hypothetical protein
MTRPHAKRVLGISGMVADKGMNITFWGFVTYLVEEALIVMGPGYGAELCEADHFR